MARIYTVSHAMIAVAYDRWHDGEKRQVGVERAKIFKNEFACILRLGGREEESELLPNNRQRWSDWRSRKQKDLVVSLEFCIALFQLTDVDISSDGAAKYSEPTRVVTIARDPKPPSAELRSNSPLDGEELYLINLPRVAFRRSDAMRVTRDWIGGKKVSEPVDIGSVFYGLRQARISVNATGAIEPKFGRLRPGEPVNNCRAEGVRLSDDPREKGTWTANSVDGEIMDGSLYLPEFAQARHNPKFDLTITVDADSSAIETDFRFSGEHQSNETRKSKARAYLLNRVLKLALSRELESLCLARVKLETDS